ncbi:MAG: nitrite/sulfite reductase [Chloroflexi bacterium]|nr:nitrite/sulfite reductase [Chloroflexota bacterium]MCI0822274.1 nitrite/sulfite reductase [Chloroflexota bacterium]
MTQTEWKPRIQGIIEVLPDEITDFEEQVKKFQAGEWEPNEFMAFRLRQGVYGQRQQDEQMLRVKAPFGAITADQLDALGVVAEKYAPLGKGHITTRENFQFHHIPLEHTPEILRILGDVGLSTREACGNTIRNVTGCALAGVCANEPFDVSPYAAAYARYFVRHPFTQAMPRKIKTAMSGCDSDCAITPIHDVGFIPKIQDGKKGFKMVAGGGTSIMPRIAPTLYEFVPVEEYLKVTEALIRVFHRTNELRKNRMKARVKFYIDRIGIDEFRKEVEEELKEPWAQRSFDPKDLLFIEDEAADAPALDGDYRPSGGEPEFQTWLQTNVETQKQDGYRAVNIKIKLGDIDARQFGQLADLSRKYAGGRARLTHQQNLTIRWVPENALYEVWQRLNEIGFGDSGVHEITDVVSCPGTDSCKLGITSSMGLARAVGDTIDAMDKSDPLVRQLHVKMSGCPNGCGQHHIADIGFHGAAAKGPGGQVPAYELFLGGSFAANDPRFGQRIKTKVPAKLVPKALEKVVSDFQANHEDDEVFKDYVLRVGNKHFEDVLAEFRELPELNRDTLDQYIDWDKTVKYVLERGEGECAV